MLTGSRQWLKWGVKSGRRVRLSGTPQVCSYTSKALLRAAINHTMIDTIDRGARREDEAEQEAFKTWSREEAQTWARNNPPLSPWRVVGVQALVGLLCAVVVWAVTQRGAATWSALYGAVTVVLPGALLARGMSRETRSPAAAAANFMFWELMKIVLAIAMLVAVAKWAPGLSWPALLVAMVACMKLGWLALLRRRRVGS